ncbi:DUF6683 family protein [Sphingobium aromaticiconvertens]|uniref:DUF6683 family protein n=1 Tax=Sphingobium aromaticiconvertens TaxID=365341 RepID=UPI0030192C7A
MSRMMTVLVAAALTVTPASAFTVPPRTPPGLAAAIDRETMGDGEQAAAVDASYRPDPAVRRKLADIMSEGAAKTGANEAQEMRQIVLSGEAVRQYEKVAPVLGYRANDAIDGLAFYLLAQWGVANDYRPDISRAQAAGVRRQAANAFASVADQVGTDAMRQEFGEMLMIQGAIMAGTHEAALRAGDEATLARYADMAREGGKALFTVDPTTLILTDEGFRRK